MKPLQITVRIFCLLPFATGTLDLVAGTTLLSQAGSPITHALAQDPVLNSQIAFWGAIWFGFGLVLWHVSADLRQKAELFRLLMAILILGGLGRVYALARFGWPGPILIGALLLELIGPPLLLLWHGTELRSRPSLVLQMRR